MSELISITLNDGKYTIRQTESGKWEALRYGEEWPAFRDSGPDNLHVALAYEVAKLRSMLAAFDEPQGSFTWALRQMLWEQADIYREAEPHIKYSFDGAEGCEIWSMNSETDDLLRHKFDCAQVIATDWRVAG